MIDTEALFKAKQALNQFLIENPKAIKMQKELEEMLNNAGSLQNRRALLSWKIQENALRLGSTLEDLVKEVIKIGKLEVK